MMTEASRGNRYIWSMDHKYEIRMARCSASEPIQIDLKLITCKNSFEIELSVSNTSLSYDPNLLEMTPVDPLNDSLL